MKNMTSYFQLAGEQITKFRMFSLSIKRAMLIVNDVTNKFEHMNNKLNMIESLVMGEDLYQGIKG